MSGIVAQNLGRRSGLVKTASGGGGNWVEIKTLTSDGSDATMSFVDGTSDVVIDSTYPLYCFRFINIHPEDNQAELYVQFNAAGGSGYNETMTNSYWRSYGDESGSGGGQAYITADDQSQGTSFQSLSRGTTNDASGSLAGFLYLFNPSSTTFVKHFISETITDANYPQQTYMAGYLNTTSAIDEVQFKMESGEIQGGKIKLFGIKDS